MNKNLPAGLGIKPSVIMTVVGWTKDFRISSPQLTPNSQLKREPSNTEEGNRTESPKASSVPQASLEIVRVLEVATVMIKIQVLFWDIGVPISIDRKVLKIDKNVCKLVSNRAVGSPLGNSFGNPRTVRINVSNDLARNSNKNEETYWKKRKAIRATSAQRNRYQIAKT
jgi:hypothetical protein